MEVDDFQGRAEAFRHLLDHAIQEDPSGRRLLLSILKQSVADLEKHCEKIGRKGYLSQKLHNLSSHLLALAVTSDPSQETKIIRKAREEISAIETGIKHLCSGVEGSLNPPPTPA